MPKFQTYLSRIYTSLTQYKILIVLKLIITSEVTSFKMASNGDNTERVISSNQVADRCVEMEDADNKGKYC